MVFVAVCFVEIIFLKTGHTELVSFQQGLMIYTKKFYSK